MYLVNAQINMGYVVNWLIRAMVWPTKLFSRETQHVLQYLKGTTQFGFWYMRTQGVKICGFTDADWERIPSDQKSTSSGIFNVGSIVISWYNKKQRSMALISGKAEYMVSNQVSCEAIWMRKILVGLFGQMMDPTVIYCDNQSCIKLSENPIFHDRSKHTDIQYHHLRDFVQRQIMLLRYISTEEQDSDILVKALSRSKFEFHRCMCDISFCMSMIFVLDCELMSAEQQNSFEFCDLVNFMSNFEFTS